jgi:tetratricopeptide (TPR) repeat protein
MPAEGIPLGVTSFVRPREWYVGYAARTFGDAEGARIAFKAARAKVEEIIREQPDYAEAWTLLERIDAALGCKEEAIREGKRGCELLPMSSDTWEGPKQVRDLAEIYAWIGEKDLAFEYLQRAGRIPGPDYGELKLILIGSRCAAIRASGNSSPRSLQRITCSDPRCASLSLYWAARRSQAAATTPTFTFMEHDRLPPARRRSVRPCRQRLPCKRPARGS